ncbi:ABC transporter ATP-binding protein [Halalkalicoccus sp. NIPERK01]|uniref:ABC transporter ATP-binding protein n=1 Tax=Halalkalicoccus sp. NIPERK01 TaxID=3053469 RepID=UPI00256ECE9E|nr:sn-glycerol-3-phosphate ABC transporter ATP-binding protein UgpC [Halalkalicoccus sp. NIPERK01]MDL5363370.1 sn-glycerol-3-phosphate ABC transporter ATP-binding protein UgpC [Halalkalicoccus sp. NIPERK01]
MGRITLNDVLKTFNDGDLVAVDHLDLEIEDGEFLVLVGPSGCGKSTTLRMIAGLETVTSGDVTIGDRRVNNLDPRDRDIAMVFQNYALYPHMTVRRNMGFGLQLSTDLPDEEINERVESTAEMMGITELLNDKPKELSGGQQQRVALGRAIVREPQAFLFDEPLSNLDAKLRTHMRTEITRIQQELDVTSIYVTHDQAEAMTMGDRIAVLNDGQLQQVGSPNEVYDHPANRFVAGFIGSPSMNFLDVTVKQRDGSQYLVADADEKILSYPLGNFEKRLGLETSQRLILGVRPEDIRHVTDETEGDRVQSAPVEVVEPMGSDNYLYLTVAEEEWTARVDSSYEPAPGEDFRYTFDSSAFHLFDHEGQTIKSQGETDAAIHKQPVTAQ